MNFLKSLKSEIINVKESDFDKLAIKIFRYQVGQSGVYQEYTKYLNININNVNSIEEIPYLPIEFFRSHKIIPNNASVDVLYESSSTTGAMPSKHYVHDSEWYLDTAVRGFEREYGTIEKFHVLALLPSYLERNNASLVAMCNRFIKKSNSLFSGFYLDDFDKLVRQLNVLKQKNEKVLLIGVSFALMNLAERFDLDLQNIIIMETGGMKGRRKELTRKELHDFLMKRFSADEIHSEYGMTELLSQAYSKGNGIFYCPPWMKVVARDINDPFAIRRYGKAGGINVIDLINLHSCSFIETKDLGIVHSAGGFEVLGRFDNSDIRGCNLMVS